MPVSDPRPPESSESLEVSAEVVTGLLTRPEGQPGAYITANDILNAFVDVIGQVNTALAVLNGQTQALRDVVAASGDDLNTAALAVDLGTSVSTVAGLRGQVEVLRTAVAAYGQATASAP